MNTVSLFFNGCCPTGRCQWLVSVLLSALCAASCGQQESPPEENGRILAQVGEETVSVQDLERFVAKLPAWTTSEQEGSAQVRDYLQTLIDRILILREARTLSLEKSPNVRKNLARVVAKKLGQEAASRHIRPRVEVDEEEIERAFAQGHWNRRLKIAHIVVSTQERADEVMAALRAGRSFDAVARQFSEYPPSARRGGELLHYYSPDGATQVVRDALFHLRVGEISEIVPNPKGYELFKVLDEQQVAYEEVRDRIRKGIVRQQLDAVRRSYIDSLAQRFGLDPDSAGLGTLMGLLRRVQEEGVGRLSVATSAMPLFKYENGYIPLGEAIEQSPFIRRGRGVDDSLKVIHFLERDVVVPRLLLLWAYELGIDREPEIKAWSKHREEETLIREIRRLKATQKVVVTDREVSRFYEENKDTYRTPSEVEIVEILVGDETEARELLEQMGSDLHRATPLVALCRRFRQKLESGQATGEEVKALRELGGDPPVFAWLSRRLDDEEQMAQVLEEIASVPSPEDLVEQYIARQLAVAQSVRPGSAQTEGHYHLHWYDEARFGPLVREAMEAEIGALIGPLAIDSLYSVAKVISRRESAIRPFAEVEERITARLRREKEHVLFGRWLEGLRTTYKDEVIFFDENIETLGRKFPAAVGD